MYDQRWYFGNIAKTDKRMGDILVSFMVQVGTSQFFKWPSARMNVQKGKVNKAQEKTDDNQQQMKQMGIWREQLLTERAAWKKDQSLIGRIL